MGHEPVIIIHLSDLHFGREFRHIDKLKETIKEILPDVVIVTGDVVDWSRKEYYNKAKEFIRNLQCDHIYITPGNHEQYYFDPNLSKFYGCFEEYFKSKLISLGKNKAVESLCIFPFDSTHWDLSSPYSLFGARGKISQRTLENFKKKSQEIKNENGNYKYKTSFKIAALHHHPLPAVSSDFEDYLRMNNAGKFLKAMAQENINLILHGHRHDCRHYTLNFDMGNEESNMAVLAGGALKESEEMNHSFFAIKIYKDFMWIEKHSYSKELDKFVPTKTFFQRWLSAEYEVLNRDTEYEIFSNGDFFARDIRRLKGFKGTETKFLQALSSVDEKSDSLVGPDNKIANLIDFKASWGGASVNISKDIELKRNEPRLKLFNIKLNPPLSVQPKVLDCSWKWPGGIKNLMIDGKDEGFFTIGYDMKSYSICFKLNSEVTGKIRLTASYKGDGQMITEGTEKIQTVTVKNPRKCEVIYIRLNYEA